VLEVGAGGRYDATNIIESPIVTAVTNIDYDHVQILGKTLLSIADNKVGIIKKGSAFFTTEKRASLLKLFEKECKEKGATFTALPVVEDYQENNKTLARAIGTYIGLSREHIEAGTYARLPGRFEFIQENPRVVLDGAHNRAKIRSCAANVQKLDYKKLHLIFALKDDKDIAAVAREIMPLADAIILTEFTNPTVQSAAPVTACVILRRKML
jgi:dihydrofolate synthase/folylpolyglutamate synthase